MRINGVHYVLLLLFIYTYAFGANSNLDCPDLRQPTSENAPWKCPDLDTNTTEEIESKLSDINLNDAKYTCQYNYVQSTKQAKGCTFLSIYFEAELASDFNRTSTIIDNYKPIDFHADFNVLGNTVEPPETYDIITKLSTDATDVLSALGELWRWVEDALGYLWKSVMFGGGNDAKTIMDKSYERLVQPYVANTTVPKGDTFSRFVTGLVTLDPDIVNGFNEKNGTLKLDSNWTDPAKSDLILSEFLEAFFKGEALKSDNANPDFDAMTSWIDVFQVKVWAFYYNLQRRLDIGYSIIAAQLLFLMMAFYAMSASARGAARYITNRESGQSSGEVKINEESIMKTLGILATVFVFYISVPSPISSDYQSTQASEVTNEMRGNDSIIKKFIRYTMKEGAYFGTMMADLGTDSFLDYIVKKQGLYTGLNELDILKAELQEMLYYFPASQIVSECEKNYNLPIDAIVEKANSKHYTHNESYKLSSYAQENKITGISIELCAKMHKYSEELLYNVAYAIYGANGHINTESFMRGKVTKALVYNHIRLQESLGWMNIIAVPYTYFMMRNQNLFFEPVTSMEDIRKKAEKFTSNIAVKHTKNMPTYNSFWKVLEGNNGTDMTAIDEFSDAERSKYAKRLTQYSIYHFLPFFSTIKNEVSQKFSAIYSDILRIERIDKGHSSIENYRLFLKKMLNESKRLYSKGPKQQEELLNEISEVTLFNPIKLQLVSQQVAYDVAMGIWKHGFTLVFLSSIAMIIGIRIVLYVIYVLIHFFISPFIVLWAFATSDEGIRKIKEYLKDTLVYMMYPTIIVLGVFIFIFAYELFYSVYGFILAVLAEGQTSAVKLAMTAEGLSFEESDMRYLSVYTLKDITELLIDLLSVYVAFVTMNKFPELVLKALGLSESSATYINQSAEKVQSQGGQNVSPLSH